MIFILSIVVYILLVFVGIRLTIPYYGFTPGKIPKYIPKEWEEIINDLNKTSITDLDFLEGIYNKLTGRYYGSRWEIFPKWQYAFEDIFAHKKGFLPCNIFNQLLRVM